MLPSRRAAFRIGVATASVRVPAGLASAAAAGVLVLPLAVRLVVSLERAALVQVLM